VKLYEKLLEIQTEVTSLKKNKDASGYKYLTMDKIMDHVGPKMDKLGLLLVQEVVDFTNERMDYLVNIKEIWENGKGTGKFTGKPKAEILTKVKMNMVWIDCETGEKLSVPWGANGQNDWEKGFGSALTYGERYFVMKFFHISTDEDDVDNPDRKKEPKIGKIEKDVKAPKTPSKTSQKKTDTTTPPTPTEKHTEDTVKLQGDIKPITDKQKARIHILFQDSVADKENLYDFYKIKSCTELNTEDAQMLIETLIPIKNDSKGNITQIQIGQMAVLLKQKGFKRAKLLEKHGLKKLDDMSRLKANEILIGLRALPTKVKEEE